MKRKEVRADGPGAALDSTNSHTINDLSKERITMFSKFSRWIGLALIIIAAFWLTGGSLSESAAQTQQCSVSFSLNPSVGTANPGGKAQFTIIGKSNAFCPILVFRPSFTPTANFSMTFNPTSATIPPNGQGTSQATVSVAATTPAAIYELKITVDLFTVDGHPAGKKELIYTLHVVGGSGQTRRLFGFKFEDQNGNGRWDYTDSNRNGEWDPGEPGEPGIAGWRIELRGPESQTAATGAQGRADFTVRTAGTYTISEETRQGWQATTETSFRITLTMQPGETYNPNFYFGNKRTGTPSPGLSVELTIDRGCGASYRIGDPIVINFRVSRDAVVTLRLRMPDGSERGLLANQPVRGGVTQTIQGTVGEPPGSRLLILEAVAGEQRGRAECAFTGVGVPDIDVFPTSIDFGAVPIGTTASRLLTIRNVGQADLFVSSIIIQGGPLSSFHFGGVVYTGFTLRPGQAATIQVFFTPRTTGLFQDSVVIRSNDPDESTAVVTLSGRTAISARIWTDQGCLENGQEALYYLEEPIIVFFRVDGVEHALVRITDVTVADSRLLFQQTVLGSQDLSFPGVITPPLGLHILLLQVLIGGAIATEARCSFLVQDQPKPDLHTTEVDIQKEAEEGAEIVVKNIVKNTVKRGIKGGDAGGFRVGIYFSKDKDFSADDRLLGSRAVSGLKRNQTSEDETKITLPKDLVPEGSESVDGFISVVADDQGAVEESNEENNTKSAKEKAKALKITVAPAEITIEPDKAKFGAIHVGTTKEVKLTITNTGKKTLKIEKLSAQAPFTALLDKEELKAKESATLTISFSPTQVGKADAKITIKSNAKNKPTLEIPVQQAEATNTAPTIALAPRSGDGAYAVRPEGTLSITVTATDQDRHENDRPDTVTVRVDGALPAGAAFDAGVLTFTPAHDQVGGNFTITFVAEDEHVGLGNPNGGRTTQAITVRVRRPDSLPWDPAWDANYPNIPVTWDDFLGDVPPSAPANQGAETHYVGPQGGVGQASFVRRSSWVRPGDRNSAPLLEHERGHFAIAEIFVRRYNAAADDAGRRAVAEEHTRIQVLYDQQTQPTGDRTRACQEAWNREIRSALTGNTAMPAGWGGPHECRR